MSDSFDDTNAGSTGDDVPDIRLYVNDGLDWQPRLKHESEKIYCYQKNPGEDFFHLIVDGEIYLTRGDEKLCLRCALRDGIVTTDRLFWQHRAKPKKSSM